MEICDCRRPEITHASRFLSGLPNCTLLPLDSLPYAPRWYEEGDALHLAKSAQDEALATFGRGFAEIAERAGAIPQVTTA